MANTISSDLQLTKVLESALRAFKRTILPLTVFSTVFKKVALEGTDTIAVPYYPIATSDSVSRAPDGSYIALATATSTLSKLIVPDKNKVQAISFTSTERSRQPAFDPVMHGALKGEKLAYDVVADILGVIRSADFNGTSIPVSTAANFDEEDVADLARICADDHWSESNRGLVLNPSYFFNLIKQPAIIDASQSGSVEALRNAIIRRLLGFDTIGSAGMQTNNGTAFAVLGANAGDLFTATAHGLAVGDRIRFPVVEGGTGLTADTGRYYVKTVPTADTFTISLTPGGATHEISADATSGTTVQKYENLAGFACLPSAILTAFAPVEPSAKMRQGNLVDYRIVEDDESDIVLEYKHLVYGDTDQEAQIIECHYGYALGETAALKPILTS